MKNIEGVKLFLLGMITAFLAMIALRPAESNVGHAENAAVAKGGDLLAVTGVQKNDSILYIIDPVNKYVAQYTLDNAKFSLRAARYFKNDLFIRDVNSKKGFSVKEAEKEAKKSLKESD